MVGQRGRLFLAFAGACAASSLVTIGLTRALWTQDNSKPPRPPHAVPRDIEDRLANLERRPLVTERVTVVQQQWVDGGSRRGTEFGDRSKHADRDRPDSEQMERSAFEWGEQLAQLVRVGSGQYEWGTELMRQFREVVETDTFAGTEIVEFDCASTLCRAEIRMNSTDPERLDRMKSELMISEPFKRNTMLLEKEDQQWEIFLAKEGTPIPRKEERQ